MLLIEYSDTYDFKLYEYLDCRLRLYIFTDLDSIEDKREVMSYDSVKLAKGFLGVEVQFEAYTGGAEFDVQWKSP